MKIGYTELRCNLPGGRQPNIATMRARVVEVSGRGSRELAPELARESGSWTQFAGWSPDGNVAVLGRGWESAENAQWEEMHRQFRFTPEAWLYDVFLVPLGKGKPVNITAVERVSFYNSGLFFWPKDPTTLGFTALIDGSSHPFRMDRDGRHKQDLTRGAKEFSYGFSSSRDGTRISYHKDYQVFLADADGSHAQQVVTGKPFNFAPSWSPDSQWVLFLSGERTNCHPTLVRADGTGLRKLADRGGYKGFILFLDVPDYHEGSSDVPVWAVDGKSVFYTAQVGERVELFQVALDGTVTALTHSEPGVLHYHPQPSPDGQWLAYGSLRKGVRQLWVRHLRTGKEHPLTNLKPGHAALWPHWQP